MARIVEEPDEDLDKCKCVCLIQLGEYDKAMQLAKGKYTFEHAYCCYRLNQVSESSSWG